MKSIFLIAILAITTNLFAA